MLRHRASRYNCSPSPSALRLMDRHYIYRIHLSNLSRTNVQILDLSNKLIAEPKGRFRYRSKAKSLEKLQKSALEGRLRGDEVKTLGETLFDALFDSVLRRNLLDWYEKSKNEKAVLCIELEIDDHLPAIAALPWEFLCLPSTSDYGELWLGTAPHITLSRRRTSWDIPKPVKLRPDERIRVAVAVAAPYGLGPVEYKRVWDELEQTTRESNKKIQVLDLVTSATTQSIDNLLEQEPHIFHFIGHARFKNEIQQEKGEIALIDALPNRPLWVESKRFSEIFNRHSPQVILLQACEGGSLSSSTALVSVALYLVQKNIPAVIAMQYEISNVTAQRFVLEFYRRLAKGDSVDKATQEGRRRIALGPSAYSTRDFATPIVFMRVRDGRLFQRQVIKSGSKKHLNSVRIDRLSSHLEDVNESVFDNPNEHPTLTETILPQELHRSTNPDNSAGLRPQILGILEALQAEGERIPPYVLESLFPPSGIMLGPQGQCSLWWLVQNGLHSRLTITCKLIISQLNRVRFKLEYNDPYFRSFVWTKILIAFAESQLGSTRRSISSLSSINTAIKTIGLSELMAWDLNIRSIIAGKLGKESDADRLAKDAIFAAEWSGAFWLSAVIKLRMLHRNDWHRWEKGEPQDHSMFEASLANNVKTIGYMNPSSRLHVEAIRSAVQVLHYSWSPTDSERAISTAQNTLSILSAQPDHAEKARMISEIGRIKLFSLGDPVNAIEDLKQGASLLMLSGNLARLRYYLVWLAEAYVRVADYYRAALCARTALALHKKLYDDTDTDKKLVETVSKLLTISESKVGNPFKQNSLYTLSNVLAESTGITPPWWFSLLYSTKF